MDCLIGLAKPDTSFFERFGKEQLSVINSRGVSLIPQLMITMTTGPQSTVSYFTKGYSFAWFDWYLLASSLRDQVLGIRSKLLEISREIVLFPPRVNQCYEPRSRLLCVTDTIKMIPLIETIQPVCSLGHCCHRPLLYSSWLAMSLLFRAHLFPHEDNFTLVAILGVWERPALPASTNNWHSVTQDILLRL